MDYFQFYSAAVASECLKKDDETKLVKLIEEFDSFDVDCDLKGFLRNNLRIKDPVQNFPLYGKGVLNYAEYESTLSIEIVHLNEHYVYCFNK